MKKIIILILGAVSFREKSISFLRVFRIGAVIYYPIYLSVKKLIKSHDFKDTLVPQIHRKSVLQ
jgi:hypothetical protein